MARRRFAKFLGGVAKGVGGEMVRRRERREERRDRAESLFAQTIPLRLQMRERAAGGEVDPKVVSASDAELLALMQQLGGEGFQLPPMSPVPTPPRAAIMRPLLEQIQQERTPELLPSPGAAEQALRARPGGEGLFPPEGDVGPVQAMEEVGRALGERREQLLAGEAGAAERARKEALTTKRGELELGEKFEEETAPARLQRDLTRERTIGIDPQILAANLNQYVKQRTDPRILKAEQASNAALARLQAQLRREFGDVTILPVEQVGEDTPIFSPTGTVRYTVKKGMVGRLILSPDGTRVGFQPATELPTPRESLIPGLTPEAIQQRMQENSRGIPPTGSVPSRATGPGEPAQEYVDPVTGNRIRILSR